MALTFVRPLREVYLRMCRPLGAWGSVDVGIEHRDSDGNDLRGAVTSLMNAVAEVNRPGGASLEPLWDLEAAIKLAFPDRAYFIEYWDKDDQWYQVFQPFGIPRNISDEELRKWSEVH